jgi:hypothetical protein
MSGWLLPAAVMMPMTSSASVMARKMRGLSTMADAMRAHPKRAR